MAPCAFARQDAQLAERRPVHPVNGELQLPQRAALPRGGLEKGGARRARHDRGRQQLVRGLVRCFFCPLRTRKCACVLLIG